MADFFGFYRRWISPPLHSISGMGGACRFQPTCSEYAEQAFSQYGVVRGSALALWRLLRCNPLCRGGFDPVPGRPPASGRGSSNSPFGTDQRRHLP